MLGREAANANFMDYGFWFDPTGDRTHDLPINLKSSTLYRYTTQAKWAMSLTTFRFHDCFSRAVFSLLYCKCFKTV
jgi:hypothetical protein